MELVVGRYRDKLTQVAGEADEPSVNMSVNFHIRKDRQERVTPASENLTSITILLSAFMIGTHLFFVGYQDTVATHYDMGTRSGCSKSYMTMSESSLSALFDVKTASRLSLDTSASYSLGDQPSRRRFIGSSAFISSPRMHVYWIEAKSFWVKDYTIWS